MYMFYLFLTHIEILREQVSIFVTAHRHIMPQEGHVYMQMFQSANASIPRASNKLGESD